MKTGKVLLYVGIYIAAAYGGYAIYKNTKSYMLGYLVKGGFIKATKEQAIKVFRDKDYIRSWYKAAKSGNKSFLFNAERYNTQGGTKIG